MNRRGFLAAIGLAPVAAVSTLVKADAAETVVDAVAPYEPSTSEVRALFGGAEHEEYFRLLEARVSNCERFINLPTARVEFFKRR